MTAKFINFHTVGRVPLYIMRSFAVGKPIAVTKTENPSQEVIDKLHNTYCQALRDLYSEYNPIYGDPSVKLNFIWTILLISELNYVDVVFYHYWNTYVKVFFCIGSIFTFSSMVRYWHLVEMDISKSKICMSVFYKKGFV